MLKTVQKELTPSQIDRLEEFGRRVNSLGANFAVCDSEGNIIQLWECGRFESCRKELKENTIYAIEKQKHCDDKVDGASVCSIDKMVAGVLEKDLVFLIDLPQESAEEIPPDESRFRSSGGLIGMVHKALGELLDVFVGKFCFESRSSSQMELVSTELAQVYEQLVLLHKINTNMSVTHIDNKFLQMACDSLTDIVNVEGIALLLEKTETGSMRLNLAAGSGLIDFDNHMAAILHNRLIEARDDGKEALLDSEVDTPFKYDWPDSIKSIIAVPLTTKKIYEAGNMEASHKSGRVIGMLVAVNRIDKPDFDSTDVKLFDSVAGSCAVFIENGRLFRDLQELFLGSLRALTNGIDAKDKYTRGHSERVAFISKWIADKLVEEGKLEKEEIPKIYLAGLLHDIGKTGVDETVLCKEGALSKYEWDCIKAHPSIGAGILNEIKQMREIIPGVLYHHERIDGRGYPNGLRDEQIPLIAKIIGMADSFDAMTSKRSYRDAMTVEQTLKEIRKGLGTQFDEKVGNAFLNSDVERLWEIMQEGMSSVYENGALSDFGTLAVGALVR